MAKITKSASSRISSKKTTSPKKSVKAVAAKKVAARKAAQRSAPAKKVLGIEKAAAKTRKLPTPQESKPDSTPVEKQSKPSVVHLPSLQQLLEAGAHFGHKVSRWNPAMKSYVFDVRNGMHVIDLTQTIGLLESAAHFLSDVTKTGNVLLVGTKGQAATIIKNERKLEAAFISQCLQAFHVEIINRIPFGYNLIGVFHLGIEKCGDNITGKI